MTYQNYRERLFEWSEDTIDWYAAACESPLNNRNALLASLILDETGPDVHIFDIGCGIGYLSLELAKKARQVTAIDLNESAVNYFRRIVTEKGVRNIEIRNEDFEETNLAETYDIAVMCLVGSTQGYLSSLSALKVKKLFCVRSAAKKRAFSASLIPLSEDSTLAFQNELDECGISYEHRVISCRFGQPLRNREDAAAFLSHYDIDASKEEIESALESRLIRTDDSAFPLYLPNEKDYAFFSIELD
jgi:SAM-dependent methyltransferase